MNKKIKIGIVVALILIAIGVFAYMRQVQKNQPSKLDSFAVCLKDKGAVFYGAYWCSHCQDQKKLFGNAARLLPYIECSTADGNGQTEECKQKNIQGYPTWRFADGSEESGFLALDRLSAKTGCQISK